jgi:hypothetical protein
MLIHASEAETLNSIRLALEREEQQIRVNDSTGEVYDITISRSAPYASPVVSRSVTPSNANDPSTNGTNGHIRTPTIPPKAPCGRAAVPTKTQPSARQPSAFPS